MNLVDTHCHLDLLEDKGGHDLASVLALVQPFPERVIQVACHPETFARTLPYLEDSRIYASFGVHPHEASLYSPAVESQLREYLSHPKCVALGEIGLDYHYDFSPRTVQQDVFREQLQLALELGKPIVLHTREAEADTLAILQELPLQHSKIHVHCYTGDTEFAQRLLALDAEVYFGFTGILSFKTAQTIREAAAQIPPDRLLTETDAPFLAPVPHRGKHAHPGMVGIVLQHLAQARQMDETQLASLIRENTRRCYGI